MWYTLRTTAEWCILRAVSGSSSQTSMPEALVAIGLNSPPTPSGRVGLHVEHVLRRRPALQVEQHDALGPRRAQILASRAFQRQQRLGIEQPAQQRQGPDLERLAPRRAPSRLAVRLPETVISLMRCGCLAENRAGEARLFLRLLDRAFDRALGAFGVLGADQLVGFFGALLEPLQRLGEIALPRTFSSQNVQQLSKV